MMGKVKKTSSLKGILLLTFNVYIYTDAKTTPIISVTSHLVSKKAHFLNPVYVCTHSIT
jgi:hypothetical protein